MKIEWELWVTCKNGCRSYDKTSELPFAPFVGLEVEFCECCSGEKVTNVVWNIAKNSFRTRLEFSDILRTCEEWHDHWIHMGFAEDPEMRDQDPS